MTTRPLIVKILMSATKPGRDFAIQTFNDKIFKTPIDLKNYRLSFTTSQEKVTLQLSRAAKAIVSKVSR